jgi:lipid II:glycine glycyltransferase (peptidoglycan interpeptide bridge formation enzyme)
VKIVVYTGMDELTDSRLFNEFFDVYHANCVRLKIAGESKEQFQLILEAFKENAIVIHAYFDNQVCAVAFFLIAGDTITGYVNGSTEVGRKKSALNLVLWEGMKAGKQKGCLWFDFDGIFDDRYPGQKEWEGFTRFKKGFGGVERTYIGSFTKWFPLLKRRKTAKALLVEQAEVN